MVADSTMSESAEALREMLVGQKVAALKQRFGDLCACCAAMHCARVRAVGRGDTQSCPRRALQAGADIGRVKAVAKSGKDAAKRAVLIDLIVEVESDNAAHLGFAPFATWYTRVQNERDFAGERKLREMFDRLDTDGSGALDKKEVGKLAAELGEKLTSVFGSKKLDEAFAEMDPENDGEVSFEKFTGWWTKQNQGSERKKELARDLVFKRDAFWARR